MRTSQSRLTLQSLDCLLRHLAVYGSPNKYRPLLIEGLGYRITSIRVRARAYAAILGERQNQFTF